MLVAWLCMSPLLSTQLLSVLATLCVLQEAADGGSATPSPLPAFYAWVAQQTAAGQLEFEVKGEEGVPAAWAEGAMDGAALSPAQPPAVEEEENECVVPRR